MITLYEDLKAAGIPTDSHESDLYALDVPGARELVNKHALCYSVFVSEIDNRLWLEIPFAFDPFWQKNRKVQ